jgi:cyclic pyranopterin phosphate synthase
MESKEPVVDVRGRALHDLRISVTDRCNFRCTYCMPKEVFGPDFVFLPQSQLLTFEETARLTRLFVQLGVVKLRITGGEPLLRRNLEHLVELLAAIPGVLDIALTTNGSLLTPSRAVALKNAGLRRVTVSLDALSDQVFGKLNDVHFPVRRVLAGIEAAEAAGLGPVKVNMVVQRGKNDSAILEMAEHFRGTRHILRFIEYMDVGNTNGWRLDDVVSAKEILAVLSSRWPLHALDAHYAGEVAKRYAYDDGEGEFGLITSVTQPFCRGCTRARLSSDGKLFTCLFGSDGFDLRQLVRSAADDETILAALENVWRRRDDRYSELRTKATGGLPKVEMSKIGG